MIEIKDIEKLAALARITVLPREKEKLAADINKILTYVDQISEAGAITSSREKAVNDEKNLGEKTKHENMVKNILREDENPHEPGIFTEKLLSEAPKREGDYLKVKKIL